MTEHELVGVDTSFEKSVAESDKGLRQRSKAIMALLSVAERLDTHLAPEIIEKMRGLTKQEAKLARQSLENLVVLFGSKPDDGTEAIVATETPEIVELVEVESLPTTQSLELVVEVEETSNTLASRVKKWLTGLVEEDVDTLTEADIPALVTRLIEERGPMKQRANSLDYATLLEAFLAGKTNIEIAQLIGSTPPTVYQAFNNFRLHILNARAENTSVAGGQKGAVIEAAAVDSFVKPTLPSSQSPVPRPPATQVTYRPVSEPLAGRVVEPKREHQEVQMSRFNMLRNSVEQPTLYSKTEWAELAEQYIREAAAEFLTPEGVDALWQHLNIDEEGEYRKAPSEYQAALEMLRSKFKKLAGKSNRQSDEQQALRILFNNTLGYKNLDDVSAIMSRSDYSAKLGKVQRITVFGIARVLKEDV